MKKRDLRRKLRQARDGQEAWKWMCQVIGEDLAAEAALADQLAAALRLTTDEWYDSSVVDAALDAWDEARRDG